MFSPTVTVEDWPELPSKLQSDRRTLLGECQTLHSLLSLSWFLSAISSAFCCSAFAASSPSLSLLTSRAPRCGSGPSCSLEGPPHPSIVVGRPFPQATASPTSPSLFPPPPLGLFAMLQEGAAQAKQHLVGARPTSGVLNYYFSEGFWFLLVFPSSRSVLCGKHCCKKKAACRGGGETHPVVTIAACDAPL